MEDEMKSPRIAPIVIVASIACAAVFLLFFARKTVIEKTGIALAHPAECQEPDARASAILPNASGPTPQLNPPKLPRQNDPTPGADPKPAGRNSANPVQTATSEVLDAPSFVAFAAAADLPAEKRIRIAEILALTQVNTESAKRSNDPTVRSLIPGRVRKDAETRILLQLSKVERDIFAREHVVSILLPEDPSE